MPAGVSGRALAQAMVGVERQPGLFDDDLPTEPVAIDRRRFHLERGRRFGDVWLAWRLWQALELERLLAPRLPSERADVPWASMAAVLDIARFCEPSSELHTPDLVNS
jgi:hypothetical protein